MEHHVVEPVGDSSMYATLSALRTKKVDVPHQFTDGIRITVLNYFASHCSSEHD